MFMVGSYYIVCPMELWKLSGLISNVARQNQSTVILEQIDSHCKGRPMNVMFPVQSFCLQGVPSAVRMPMQILNREPLYSCLHIGSKH
jgi:hypothetical protein